MSETIETVIVGGGQAGLAMGHELSQRGREYLILDAFEQVGDAWRNRWDSLTLFTPRSYSALPGLPLSGDPDGYASKDEIADYLASYALHFALAIRLGTPVRSMEQVGEEFRLHTDRETIEARSVVIASGAFQVPAVPAMASALSPTVAQLTPTSYRNPSSVPQGTVLVVGDGATGRQIARELARSHSVLLSAGRRRQVVRDRILGRSIFWWLERLGLQNASKESRIGHRLMVQDAFPGRHLDLRRLQEMGITVVPRLADTSGTAARFIDGQNAEIDAVVWATGYRDDTSWVGIPEVVGPDGQFVHTHGISPVHGLYFIGRSWQRSRSSALLQGVGRDAAFIETELGRAQALNPLLGGHTLSSTPMHSTVLGS